MPSPVPRRHWSSRVARGSTSGGLPHRSRGSAPAWRVSRFARRSLALWPAGSLAPRGSRFLECFSPSRYLLEPLRVLPVGATSYRAGFAPARINTPLHGTRTDARKALGLWCGPSGAGEQTVDFVRQRDAVLPLVRGQLVQLRRLEQPRQLRVTPPHPDPRQKVAARAGIAVERLVPGGQVRPQPLPRLLPPARPLRFPHARDVLAAGAADQGGGAGGADAATGLVILGHGRVRGRRKTPAPATGSEPPERPRWPRVP